jgi:hypothetical protein
MKERRKGGKERGLYKALGIISNLFSTINNTVEQDY